MTANGTNGVGNAAVPAWKSQGSSVSNKVVSFTCFLNPSLRKTPTRPPVWMMATADAPQIAITGAASGMGLAIAKLLAERGARLSLADMNEEGLKKAINSLENSDQHIYTRVDVRESKSVDNWIARTVEKFGRLDGAVNFAGVGRLSTIANETDEGWDFIMNINAKGVFNCLRAQIKVMGEGGSIVSSHAVDDRAGSGPPSVVTSLQLT